MKEYKVILTILAMAALTYIPRAIPAVFIEKMKFGKKFQKFLNLIPYTVMAALIFPSVLSADSDRYEIGIIGALASAAAAYFNCPVILCVIFASLADFILYLI